MNIDLTHVVILAFQVRKSQRDFWSTPRALRTKAMVNKAKKIEQELDEALVRLGYSFQPPAPEPAEQQKLI